MAVDLPGLQGSISRLGLEWQAGQTTNSGHSDLQARNRCGAVPPAGTTLADREEQARAALSAAGPAAPAVPAAWDWRNVGGVSYITPIEDQGGCGSCVAFASIATFEAQVQIAAQGQNGVDLSEAQLWFCYGPSHGAGACPGGGWWPVDSFPGLVAGIVPATCFPYTDANQPCNLCAGWNTKLTHVGSWESLTSQAAMKAFIAATGPMTTCFTVYEDFYYYYTGGVYRYNPETSGSVIGGHCVSIVGYSDAGKYWIAKNSWGPGWGENGYFQIGYGDCGIDADMFGINGAVTSAAWHLPQADWKWCNKCQALAFAGNATVGACSAGGVHDHVGSGDYLLANGVTNTAAQSNWRWCSKCQVLAFAGNATLGACAAGGLHNHAGSGDYLLGFNVPSQWARQSDWRWCNKCQVLAFAGNATLGACPAGGLHDHTGSGDYGLAFVG
ncbi:MAG: C1 family peptidase [Streptosporangiaceae bacterium]